MKYKTAKVISHPRAGSHYLAKLLNANFFHKDSYLELYAGHGSGHLQHLKSPSTAVFYIYRNSEDTIKSMFVLRDRFGLVADNIEEFKTKKLNEMHNKNISSNAVFNGKSVTDVDTYFSTIPLTIEEYLKEHREFWYRPGLFVVNYQALIEDFQQSMGAIAFHLGSDRREFINVTKRVGWYDASDEEKIFT